MTPMSGSLRQEVDVRLTDDRASFEVWPVLFVFPCSDVAAQLA